MRTAERRPHASTREDNENLASAARSAAIDLVAAVLRRSFGPDGFVRVHVPLDLGTRSKPKPDVSVVRGVPRDYSHRHPTTALLVVDVSDTASDRDRREQASLYASVGVREYWVLNLIDSVLKIRSEPCRDSATPFGHAYGRTTHLGRDDTIDTALLSAASVRHVHELLP